jgi:ribonuclease D
MHLINTDNGLDEFRACLPVTEISLDLEGDNLCRDGRITKIQVYMPAKRETFIFDCSSSQLNIEKVVQTLKSILSSHSIVKYMFDCRADVDALYHQLGIELNSVIDVQLWEVGFRKCSGQMTRFFNGLKKSLSQYQSSIGISGRELAIKEKFANQFNRKDYTLSLHDAECVEYMMIDVVYLHKLYELFAPKVARVGVFRKIENETQQRLNIWQKATFVKGRSNALNTSI